MFGLYTDKKKVFTVAVITLSKCLKYMSCTVSSDFCEKTSTYLHKTFIENIRFLNIIYLVTDLVYVVIIRTKKVYHMLEV